jgi:hypothetical protein
LYSGVPEGGSMDKEISGEKITQILEETRVVIPGTEIFLAFQLGAIFTEVFSRLAPLYKQTHICSFILVTSSIIVLISIAPYHRIRDQGKNTSRTLWYANRMLLISMFIMATGISVDIWLVCAIATSTTLAWYIAVSVWSLAILVWFVLPYLRREAT